MDIIHDGAASSTFSVAHIHLRPTDWRDGLGVPANECTLSERFLMRLVATSPTRFAMTPELRVQGIAEQVFTTEPLRPVHNFPIAELAFTSKPEADEHSKPDVL